MKTMAITDFKMHALQVLGEVAETREPVVVTKRGKPLARDHSVCREEALARQARGNRGI